MRERYFVIVLSGAVLILLVALLSLTLGAKTVPAIVEASSLRLVDAEGQPYLEAAEREGEVFLTLVNTTTKKSVTMMLPDEGDSTVLLDDPALDRQISLSLSDLNGCVLTLRSSGSTARVAASEHNAKVHLEAVGEGNSSSMDTVAGYGSAGLTAKAVDERAMQCGVGLNVDFNGPTLDAFMGDAAKRQATASLGLDHESLSTTMGLTGAGTKRTSEVWSLSLDDLFPIKTP